MKTNGNIKYFLGFPKNSQLYSEMASKTIDVLLNIELLFKNKIRLDSVYHEPDNFILELNNLIRNTILLVEIAKKSSTKYNWLYLFIKTFLKNYNDDYVILKAIRNSSLHQEFLVTEGTIEFGLYRIISPTEYRLKLGVGDFQLQGNIDPLYLFSPTISFFNKILFLHQYLFIDIEHSAVDECLGVTRRWLCKIDIRNNNNKAPVIVDIYEITSKFASALIYGISEAFKKEYSISDGKSYFCHIPDKYNFINTILEIDLYPDFFTNQWGGNRRPLNFSFSQDFYESIEFKARNDSYLKLINRLPKDPGKLLAILEYYSKITIEDFQNQEEYELYTSLITFPHLFIKAGLQGKHIFDVDFTLIAKLQTIGLEYVQNIDMNFDTTSNEEKNEYINQMGSIIQKLFEGLVSVK